MWFIILHLLMTHKCKHFPQSSQETVAKEFKCGACNIMDLYFIYSSGAVTLIASVIDGVHGTILEF